jgi:hypothetical protein
MIKCVCVVQGGCDMCIRFNRKFMFCTDRGIHLSFWLCWEYAASALENFHFITRCYRDFHFTAYHYGIPVLPSAGRINVIFQRFGRGRKPNFRYRCDKNVIPWDSCFQFDYRLPLCLSFRFLYCIALTSVTRTLNGWWKYLLGWNLFNSGRSFK